MTEVASKSELRLSMLAHRKNIENRCEKDKLVYDRLLSFLNDNFPLAKNIFTYVSMGSEVDTHKFILQNFSRFNLFFPFTFASGEMFFYKPSELIDLSVDKYGNQKSPNNGQSPSKTYTMSDITLVPLVCFNEKLHRIGYGKGCYDNYFKNNGSDVKVGLAYDEQLVNFENEPFDYKLDYIVTPTRVY